jgi:hypothetical protein
LVSEVNFVLVAAIAGVHKCFSPDSRSHVKTLGVRMFTQSTCHTGDAQNSFAVLSLLAGFVTPCVMFTFVTLVTDIGSVAVVSLVTFVTSLLLAMKFSGVPS